MGAKCDALCDGLGGHCGSLRCNCDVPIATVGFIVPRGRVRSTRHRRTTSRRGTSSAVRGSYFPRRHPMSTDDERTQTAVLGTPAGKGPRHRRPLPPRHHRGVAHPRRDLRHHLADRRPGAARGARAGAHPVPDHGVHSEAPRTRTDSDRGSPATGHRAHRSSRASRTIPSPSSVNRRSPSRSRMSPSSSSMDPSIPHRRRWSR